MNTDK